MRKRTVFRWLVALNVLTAVVLSSAGASAAGPRVRVIHASPDAPSVDVWADAKPAFTNAPFKGITPYATLTAGAHQFQVVPAARPRRSHFCQPVPGCRQGLLHRCCRQAREISRHWSLKTIMPPRPRARRMFASYMPRRTRLPWILPSRADLSSSTISPSRGLAAIPLSMPVPMTSKCGSLENLTWSSPFRGIKLENGGVYTAWAMGLAAGDPKLSAVLSVDRTSAAAPSTLPVTGANDFNLMAMAALIGPSLIVLGFAAVRRPATQSVRK